MLNVCLKLQSISPKYPNTELRDLLNVQLKNLKSTEYI